MTDSIPRAARRDALGPGLELGRLRDADYTFPAAERGFPLVVRPDRERGFEWLRARLSEVRDRFHAQLHEVGAILLRGFDVRSIEEFEELLLALGVSLSERYPLGAAARHRVGRFAMTTTEMLDLLPLTPHSEMAYRRLRPRVVALYCRVPPPRDGETPIYDSRAALADLDPVVQSVLRAPELTWRHYYRPRRGSFATSYEKAWPEEFGSSDRAEVERLCAALDARCEWHKNGRLAVVSSTPSIIPHPVTGEATLAFQTPHLDSFLSNVRRLRPRHGPLLNGVLRLLIRAKAALGSYPFEACDARGVPLPGALFQAVDDALWRHATVFRWERGDVLVLDNALAHHSRLNVVRPREIFIALGDMHRV